MKRFLQLLLAGVFGLAGIALIVSGFMRGTPTAGFVGLVPLLMGGIFYWILEKQIRSYAAAGLAVKANIEACSKAVFDAPGQVVEAYDIQATTTSMIVAGFAREATNKAAYTTEGTFRDARVSVASHVSVMGRQLGEFHHTYSHVLVDVLGLARTFKLSREGAAAKLAKAVGGMTDATVGEQDFDKTFIVGTDPAFARAVLDESIRRRLLHMQSQVKNVSIDSGVGCMTLTLTRKGLALRWPGEMTPELAIFIRDLLLDMRANMLAYETRAAARIGTEATTGSTGYRVASDEEPAAEQEAAQSEAQNAAG